MYADLLNNLAVTTSFLFILGVIFQNLDIGGKAVVPLRTRVYLGMWCGLLGIILMLTNIEVTDDLIIDLRHLALIIAAVFGGPVSAIIAGVLMGITRIVFFGVTTTSIVASISIISLGIIIGYYSKLNIPKMYKHIIMNCSHVITTSIIILVMVEDLQTSFSTFQRYWVVSIIGGILTYYVIDYIRVANDNHRSILYYKLMADNSSDLIATHELDGQFKYASPSSIHLLGYEPDELVGRNPYDFYHPDDLAEIEKSHSTVRDSSIDTVVRFRHMHKDGRYVWLETASRRISGVTSELDELITISRDITSRKDIEDQLRRANDKLQKISLLDGLTEIPNRRGFDEYIAAQWQIAFQNGASLSLVMFDVDYFKNYNDTYGHHLGDECLKRIAKVAQSTLIEKNGYVARYGGEEFAIILPDAGRQRSLEIAEHVRNAVQQLAIPHITSKILPMVTISAGVATLLPSKVVDSTSIHLIQAADEALYRAKNEGRNRVV